MRDEIILALDLYRIEGRNPSTSGVEELSQDLRAIPIEAHLAANLRFRNASSVRLKIANFVALDPGAETAGMSRGSHLDGRIFTEFWDDPDRLSTTAATIRETIRAGTAIEIEAPDEEIEEAPEGRVLTRVHQSRERNARLRRRKKELALERNGRLCCEACGFDFSSFYGERGRGFMEVHHTVPVRDLKPDARTRLQDLALLCANCHRMIHTKSPWLSVEQLKQILL